MSRDIYQIKEEMIPPPHLCLSFPVDDFLRKMSLVVLALCISGSSFAQISGIINSYAKVNTITGADLDVSSIAGFSVGDKVLLIQMKGAQIDNTASPAYGDILAYDNAGNYEFTEIASIAGSTITLLFPPCNTYTISGCVQLVSVPVYANETVNGTLTAAPWNGTTGGVLALEATGTLTMNADMDVNALGLRGGSICSGSFSCADISYFSGGGGFCLGGEKGEGIAEYNPGEENNRGKLANGGGGANRGNCGGGGGSNYGTGGLGGDFWSGCGPTAIQGIGGAPLDYSIDRAFLGGGGGGGFRDNGQPAADGANGGGIVFLTAGTVDGMGNNIFANGGDVTLITNDEGAGGGGGGGSVVLRVGTYSSALNISANGGKGGDTQNFIFTGNCHGPGGGGGGGFIGTDVALPGTVSWTATGGPHGNVLHNSSDCGPAPTAHGATDGLDGDIAVGLTPLVTPPIIDLGNDTSICAGEILTLDAGIGFTTYLWSDGSGLQTLDINTTGTYFVEALNDCGIAFDTLNLDIDPLPIVDLGPDLSFCNGEIVTLDAGPASAWLWQDGTATQTYDVSTSGIFSVTVTDANGCEGTDDVNAVANPLPVLDLGPDILICEGLDATISAESGFVTYEWTDEITPGTIGNTLQILVADSGTYYLEVFDANDCSTTDSIKLLYSLPEDCASQVTIPNAFTPNSDGLNDIFKAVPQGEIRSYSMQVFNRWGDQIFSTDDIELGWDGSFKGEQQEMGTYVYFVQVELLLFGKFTEVVKSGNLTLIR